MSNRLSTGVTGPRRRHVNTSIASALEIWRTWLADSIGITVRAIKACTSSKCEWRAASSRDDLIATHGADYAMPSYLTISPHRVAAGSTLIGIAAASTMSSRSRAHGNSTAANKRSTSMLWTFSTRSCYDPRSSETLASAGRITHLSRFAVSCAKSS
jgi:hypothetical protein